MQLETQSYPEDEAATYEKLDYRSKNAANVFLVAVKPGVQCACASDQHEGAWCQGMLACSHVLFRDTLGGT